jgi:hypothetical protein
VDVDVAEGLRHGGDGLSGILSRDDAGMKVVCNCLRLSSMAGRSSPLTLVLFVVVFAWLALGSISSRSSSSGTLVSSHNY